MVTEPWCGSKRQASRRARRKASCATSSAMGECPTMWRARPSSAALEAPYEGDRQVVVAGGQASKQSFVGAGRGRGDQMI